MLLFHLLTSTTSLASDILLKSLDSSVVYAIALRLSLKLSASVDPTWPYIRKVGWSPFFNKNNWLNVRPTSDAQILLWMSRCGKQVEPPTVMFLLLAKSPKAQVSTELIFAPSCRFLNTSFVFPLTYVLLKFFSNSTFQCNVVKVVPFSSFEWWEESKTTKDDHTCWW